MGKKKMTTIRIDEDLLKQAHELGLNVSKVCENALKEYIKRLQGFNPSIESSKPINMSKCESISQQPRRAGSPVWLRRRPHAAETVDWEGFEAWLFREYRLRTARDRLSYARDFSHCLLNRDLSELRKLSDDKRVHVMKALSALSKFLGIYDEFKALVRNYGLKWAGKGSDEIVIARITKSVDGNDMFDWMRKVKAVCLDFSDFIDFMAATGLRYEEAVNAWNLIIELNQQNKLNKYYKKDKQALEHFRFKKIFIRRSKKAFISFVPNSLIAKIIESKKLTVGILPNRLKRRKMKLRFGDIRELHCSLLTKYLRQPEIDFLHGRVSTNVFMRNYFNPVWISDLQKRALKAAKQILAEIN